MKLTKRESEYRQKAISAYHLKKQDQRVLDAYAQYTGTTYKTAYKRAKRGLQFKWYIVILAVRKMCDALTKTTISMHQMTDAVHTFNRTVRSDMYGFGKKDSDVIIERVQ